MHVGFLSPALQETLAAWLLILLFCGVAALIAYVFHRIVHGILRRVTRHRPLVKEVLKLAYGPSQLALTLLGIRVVLTGAPRELAFVPGASYVVGIALIATLTWLAMRCVQAVGNTVIQANPYDVADNLKARRVLTQTRVLVRSAMFVLGLIGLSFALLTLPGARQIGASLLASAGIVGLVAGIAAQPVLGNFIAGLQIALSQPIRIDDVLIVEGEWGRVEEITGTFVVVRVWDERRLIVPLRWFIENPFQNWTHRSASILGTVFLWLDFGVPIPAVRAEFERIVKSSQLWDGRVCVLHVTETSERAAQIRLLVSAKDSGTAFDLRCAIREAMIAFVAREYPEGLPRLRAETAEATTRPGTSSALGAGVGA
ncbi:mechanosensitive ion channel [Achromobacter sp. GG226]|uniref:mechanosensitive ion channel family protein n=1 Tax=Verticiella alkaliphila TaxID=2779529 RepID=UPI001C0CF05B|nr:mechanosensitive ion channel domain-containing protein [Verticiella sp. GG226]MBU4609045.1 mechanosensitive ion channel [Verticiella sp. GG226]